MLRAYKMIPLIAPHYSGYFAVLQNIEALASRSAVQARDIFDLYLMGSQFEPRSDKKLHVAQKKIDTAYKNLFEVSFEQFRDTVLSYLPFDDQVLWQAG